MHPSEYAYNDESVVRYENQSANCRRYPVSSQGANIYTGNYIHCNGTHLKLTDSDLGNAQHTGVGSSYYSWSKKTTEQLLFIFSEKVTLTTITLHYYSTSGFGLPVVRFFAVPNHFDIWDATSLSLSYVQIAAVPPDGQPNGPTNVSINFNFHTGRVLLSKLKSEFIFAVSEVEFFTCNGKLN